MSDRFTVLLNDENAAWLEGEAEERDRSKAWVVNEALRTARGEESTYGVNTGDVNTGEAFIPRLDELEQRVAELERPGAERRGAEPTPADDDAVRAAVAAVDLPAAKDEAECADAVRAAERFLEERESATMREFVTGVMPDHPVGYDAEQDVARINDPDERNRSTWWRKVIKPGFESLDTVESPAPGASEWRYVG